MSTLPRRSAIVLAVQTPDDSLSAIEASLRELEQLLDGLAIQVAHRLVQRRPNTTGASLLGEGKLRELAARAAEVELIVVDAELSPGQQRALELATGVEVLDRYAVILRIFEQRAQTREARLEVELAQLIHALPRIRDDTSLGDREGGGGRGGRGHSNVELAKQRHRERIAGLRRELQTLQASGEARRRQRQEARTVAIVGYTNAGKSSLMRQLTGSDVLVRDSLFATLGTTVRRLTPATQPEILIADTVGFVRRLPHALVASFRSTLDEARAAALLLCVADATDPELADQLAVTRRVLAEIGAGGTPLWLVLNKIDRVDELERARLRQTYPDALQVSALSAADGLELHRRIVQFFDQGWATEQIEVPYAKQGVLAELRAQLRIESEEYGPTIRLLVRGSPETLAKLKARLSRGAV